MTASQTDIYFCKIEAMYPPPYVYNEKSNGTVIHVRGKLRTCTPVSFLYTLPTFWIEAEKIAGLPLKMRIPAPDFLRKAS